MLYASGVDLVLLIDVAANESPYPDAAVAFDDLYTDSKFALHTYNDSTYGTLENVR